MIQLKRVAIILGMLGSGSSMGLWLVLNFYNPYSNVLDTSVLMSTFVMLFLPACLAMMAVMAQQKYMMLIAFLWSLPISLYMLATPGVFAMFGITVLTYLASFILMVFAGKTVVMDVSSE